MIDRVVFSGEYAGAPPVHEAIFRGLSGMEPLFMSSKGCIGITSTHHEEIGDAETIAAFGVAELSFREAIFNHDCCDPETGWKVISGCPVIP